MTIAIRSEMFLRSTFELEEYSLNSFQLSFSQIFQNFQKEATSPLTLCSLVMGGAIARTVELSCFKSFSSLSFLSGSNLSLFAPRLASLAGIVTEGAVFAAFPMIQERGSFSSLAIGTGHGSLVIGLSRMVGKYTHSSFLISCFAQDCTVIAVDVGFESLNLREVQNIGATERWLHARAIAFQMHISGNLCRQIPFTTTHQAQFELHKTIHEASASHPSRNKRGWISPFSGGRELATSEGFLLSEDLLQIEAKKAEKLKRALFSEMKSNRGGKGVPKKERVKQIEDIKLSDIDINQFDYEIIREGLSKKFSQLLELVRRERNISSPLSYEFLRTFASCFAKTTDEIRVVLGLFVLETPADQFVREYLLPLLDLMEINQWPSDKATYRFFYVLEIGLRVKKIPIGKSLQLVVEQLEREKNLPPTPATELIPIPASQMEFFRLVENLEKEMYPLKAEFMMMFLHENKGKKEAWTTFLPDWFFDPEMQLLTPSMVEGLRTNRKMLSVGVGPGLLERFLVSKLGVPSENIVIADISATDVPKGFQFHEFDMHQAWPEGLEGPFDYIVFPESYFSQCDEWQGGLARDHELREKELKEEGSKQFQRQLEFIVLMKRALAHLKPGGEIRLTEFSSEQKTQAFYDPLKKWLQEFPVRVQEYGRGISIHYEPDRLELNKQQDFSKLVRVLQEKECPNVINEEEQGKSIIDAVGSSSPFYHARKGYFTHPMLQSLKQGGNLLIIDSGNSYLADLLTKQLGVLPNQIDFLEPPNFSFTPKSYFSFQAEAIDSSWISPRAPYSYIIIPNGTEKEMQNLGQVKRLVFSVLQNLKDGGEAHLEPNVDLKAINSVFESLIKTFPDHAIQAEDLFDEDGRFSHVVIYKRVKNRSLLEEDPLETTTQVLPIDPSSPGLMRSGEIVQIGEFQPFQEGDYRGVESVGKWKELANFNERTIGIGALAQLQAEFIIISGKICYIDSNGRVQEANPSDQILFGMAVSLDPTDEVSFSDISSFQELEQKFQKLLPSSDSQVYAIRAEGEFSSLLFRAPYLQTSSRPFSIVAEEADRFPLQNKRATLAGLWTPPNRPEIVANSGPGLHLHAWDLESEAQKAHRGTHLLDLAIQRAKFSFAPLKNIHVLKRKKV